MILFPNLKIRFVHIPRCAGTTVTSVLAEKDGAEMYEKFKYSMKLQRLSKMHTDGFHRPAPTPNPEGWTTVAVIRRRADILESCYWFAYSRGKYKLGPVPFIREVKLGRPKMPFPVRDLITVGGVTPFLRNVTRVLIYDDLQAGLQELVRDYTLELPNLNAFGPVDGRRSWDNCLKTLAEQAMVSIERTYG